MPKGTELHVGFFAPQSKHILFAGFAFNLVNICCDCVFVASAMLRTVKNGCTLLGGKGVEQWAMWGFIWRRRSGMLGSRCPFPQAQCTRDYHFECCFSNHKLTRSSLVSCPEPTRFFTRQVAVHMLYNMFNAMAMSSNIPDSISIGRVRMTSEHHLPLDRPILHH